MFINIIIYEYIHQLQNTKTRNKGTKRFVEASIFNFDP